MTDMAEDLEFFTDHPDRRFRIRDPIDGEYHREFRSLGAHHANRRRVLVSRVDEKRARLFRTRFARIPFLAFADETIVDVDAILEPLFKSIMTDAAAGNGTRAVF